VTRSDSPGCLPVTVSLLAVTVALWLCAWLVFWSATLLDPMGG